MDFYFWFFFFLCWKKIANIKKKTCIFIFRWMKLHERFFFKEIISKIKKCSWNKLVNGVLCKYCLQIERYGKRDLKKQRIYVKDILVYRITSFRMMRNCINSRIIFTCSLYCISIQKSCNTFFYSTVNSCCAFFLWILKGAVVIVIKAFWNLISNRRKKNHASTTHCMCKDIFLWHFIIERYFE